MQKSSASLDALRVLDEEALAQVVGGRAATGGRGGRDGYGHRRRRCYWRHGHRHCYWD